MPIYLLIAGAMTYLVGRTLGREIFPVVDAGQIQLRLRAPAGTRIEATEKLAQKALESIAREVGPDNVEITLGYVGVQNAAYPINTIYLWTSGSSDAVVQVQLKPSAKLARSSFRNGCDRRCRPSFPAYASASNRATSSPG